MEKKKLSAKIALIIPLLALAAVLALTFIAVFSMAGQYKALVAANLSQGLTGTIGYNDHLYAMMLHGIEIVPGDPQTAEQLSSFIANALQQIDTVIVSACAIYTLAVSVLLAYYLCLRCGEKPLLHNLAIIFSTTLIYAILIAAVVIGCLIGGVPFSWPQTGYLPFIIAGLLSVIGGCCVLGWLLRKIKYKMILAIIAVPAIFITFLFSFVFEAGLYCPRTVESFRYFYEQHPEVTAQDYQGDCYYDEVKNVFVLEGQEYAPQLETNENRYSRLQRLLTMLYEIAVPHSGTPLSYVRWALQDQYGQSPDAAVTVLYYIKALFWILITAGKEKKKA